MPNQFDHRVAQKISQHAPGHARAYYLQSVFGRFPSSGGFMLDPFQPPLTAPTGSYRIYYTLSTNDSSALEQGAPAQVVEIYDPFNLDDQKTNAHPIARESKQELKQAVREKWQDDPQHVRDRIEYQAAVFANDLDENKVLLGRKMRQATEGVEGLVLARAYRRELITTTERFAPFMDQQLQIFEKMTALQLAMAERVQVQANAQALAQSQMALQQAPRSRDTLGEYLPTLVALGTTIARGYFGQGIPGQEEAVVDSNDANLDADNLKALLKEKKNLLSRLNKVKGSRNQTPDKKKTKDRAKGSSTKKAGKAPPSASGAKKSKDKKESKASSAGAKETQPAPAVKVGRAKSKKAVAKKARADGKIVKGVLGSGSPEKS